MQLNTEEKTTENWLKEAQKGYIRVAVLMLLNRKPSHGYEIMKEIRDRTRGFYKPTPGGVYPILRNLEKTGYIEGQWRKQKNRKIKTYEITEKGQTILRKAVVRQSEIANNVNTLFQEFVRDVLNVKSATYPIPVMPDPFVMFLGEHIPKSASVDELEKQRKKLKEHIDVMQEKLKSIEDEIAEEKAKKTKEKT